VRHYTNNLAMIGLLATALGCGSGKGRSDEELDGLVTARKVVAEPIAIDKAVSDVAELRRALLQPHHVVADTLGSHAFRGSSSVRLSTGSGADPVETLDDETAIDFAASGAFRASLDNSREYGRHVVYSGDTLYLQPRFGKYHERAPTDPDEPGHIRDDIYATFGDYFDLVSAAAKLEDRGAVTHEGRAAHAVGFTLGERRKREYEASQKLWRNDAVVTELSGEVILDDATGAALSGTLSGSVAFARDGTNYTMAITAKHAISAVGTDPSIEPPPDDQTVATRVRSHELEQRDSLLEGIAPPLRKAPAPP
jgi:hypothetical protein